MLHKIALYDEKDRYDRKGRKKMKICMVEACEESDKGSIGAFYIRHHAERVGYQVDVLSNTSTKYDVELISVHHCTDFVRLAKMPKRAKIRIVGGHPMQNNPRPVIPYADIVCIGEGETWISKALPLIEKYGIDGVLNMPGTIVSKNHCLGDAIPKTLHENPLPENPPYLNRPGTRSAAWYVEIARGCPFSCSFCELGHSSKFRKYDSEYLKSVLDQCDLSKTRKINFYAPDEASHPGYRELYEYLKGRGFLAGFSSMRVESILKNMPPIRANQLIRVGIDGMSEDIRKKVGKPISDHMIIEYFKKLLENGHVQFKMFFIFSYPFETDADFECFEKLMSRIFMLDLKKNVSLRLKWTPFIPQPCTPMKDAKPAYSFDMYQKIELWHAKFKRPRNNPGWYIDSDGIMSWKSHTLQCQLTAGDETALLKYGKPITKMM